MRHHFVSSTHLHLVTFGEIDAGGVLMIMPFTQAAMAQSCARQLAQRANARGTILCVHDDAREGFVALVNRAFRLTQPRWVGYVAQDAFAGRDWLSLALARVNACQACLLGFNDGKWMGELAGFGLVDRRWAESNYDGDLFHPGYSQHFADTELTLLARQAGCYAYEPNSVLIEIDAEKDRKPVNAADRALFLARRRDGFGGRVRNAELLGRFS